MRALPFCKEWQFFGSSLLEWLRDERSERTDKRSPPSASPDGLCFAAPFPRPDFLPVESSSFQYTVLKCTLKRVPSTVTPVEVTHFSTPF
jgi:hypothetical protein